MLDSTSSPAQRLLMLGLNYLPLLHVAIVAAAVGIAWGPLPWRSGTGVILLYLAPALVARIVLALAPITEGRIRDWHSAPFSPGGRWPICKCSFPACPCSRSSSAWFPDSTACGCGFGARVSAG